MNANSLESLIFRAATDRSFRDALLADPDRALADQALDVEPRVRVALHKYVQAARR